MDDQQTTDLILEDIVETTRMIGRRGRYVTSVCKTCGTQHKCTLDEFGSKSFLIEQGGLEYVAEMRAWNCCHDGAVPLDGYPEETNVPGVQFS